MNAYERSAEEERVHDKTVYWIYAGLNIVTCHRGAVGALVSHKNYEDDLSLKTLLLNSSISLAALSSIVTVTHMLL